MDFEKISSEPIYFIPNFPIHLQRPIYNVDLAVPIRFLHLIFLFS